MTKKKKKIESQVIDTNRLRFFYFCKLSKKILLSHTTINYEMVKKTVLLLAICCVIYKVILLLELEFV